MTESKGFEHRFEDMTASALSEFARIEAIAGAECDVKKVQVDIGRAPHRPKGLPAGRMAVYCFFFRGQALKIGIAGPNSDARYRSQHYGATRARSTLAGSISKYPGMIGLAIMPAVSLGDWIKENTARVNFLIPATLGRGLLTRFEIFLHGLWRPTYEGRVSAR